MSLYKHVPTTIYLSLTNMSLQQCTHHIQTHPFKMQPSCTVQKCSSHCKWTGAELQQSGKVNLCLEAAEGEGQWTWNEGLGQQRLRKCVSLSHTHHRIPSSLWSISDCQLSPSTDNVCRASLYTHVLRHTPYCEAHLCLYWDAHLYQYQDSHLCWVCSLNSDEGAYLYWAAHLHWSRNVLRSCLEKACICIKMKCTGVSLKCTSVSRCHNDIHRSLWKAHTYG